MPNEDSEPSHSSPIEILLVDDPPHVRKLLREMIETYDDLKIVGEAVNGEEAVLLAAKLKPAAVVMDVHLPVLNGVPATTLIDEQSVYRHHWVDCGRSPRRRKSYDHRWCGRGHQ
jgi:DNA-binding NarL/FixJ family response regulator